MLFAHKRFLVSVEVAEDDGYLDFGETVQPYFKGNYITTDEYGNHAVLTESYFKENYLSVRKLGSMKKSVKSPFELAALEEAYKQDWVSEEDDQYINGTHELSMNKAF